MIRMQAQSRLRSLSGNSQQRETITDALKDDWNGLTDRGRTKWPKPAWYVAKAACPLNG